MIEPPNSNDLSISRPSRKDQSKREHKSKKRRRHRSSSFFYSTFRSDSLSSSRRKKNSKRSKHSHKKRRRRSMTAFFFIKFLQSQLDIGRYTRAHKSPRLFKGQLQYNLRRLILVKSQINLLITIRFSRISLNRIRSQIRKLNPKSGHLIVRLTRSSGFFLLSYAPKLSRIKLH